MPTRLNAEFVSTANGSLLRAVRSTIVASNEVLICVAYMKESGVRLLADELTSMRARRIVPRLLVTTALGTTDARSLEMASRLGADLRIYNPGRGTFHPKVYMGRRGRQLADAWSWAEALWQEPVVEYWDPRARARIPDTERFEPPLFALLRPLEGRQIFTLARRQPNTIAEVAEDRVIIRTTRSPRGQPVPAWMFNIAWSYLTTHGRLANQHLCDELRVHRSAAVVAVLAQLPGVRVADERTATVELVGR